MNSKPLIGITLDSQTESTYSVFPWYALRKDYSNAVQALGGIPIHLPHEPDNVSEYLNLIDGLIISGGDFDIDPAYYGEEIVSQRVIINNKRTDFEFSLGQQALDQNIPILGICGGMQLLNVILGGTLIQHIPDAIQSEIQHEQPHPKNVVSHSVHVEENSLLHQLLGQTEIQVNSTHHQAIKRPGNGVVCNAFASDGVIEGFEIPKSRFCLGVQWHPEYLSTPHDKTILEAFLAEARK